MKKAPPKAYTALLEKEAVESAKTSKMWKERREKQAAEELALYKGISKALRAYNGVVIDRHNLTVKNIPAKNTSQLFVDGKLWMTFVPERHVGSCSCEAPCDCEYTSWLTLDVIQHQKDGPYHCWFPCDESNMNDATAFAHAMKEAMSSYKYRDL